MNPRASPLSRWAVLTVGFPIVDAHLQFWGSRDLGHLVVEVSPRPVDAAEILLHDAPPYLRPAGTTRIHGVKGRWYRVLGESIFTGHLALVWTWAGHTCAVGFHTWTSDSRRYGYAVARGLVFVSPT